MKKLFAATLLTLLLAVNLFAANHTLNRISNSCSHSSTVVGLQAVWADNGPPVPNPACPNYSYGYTWTVGDFFDSGHVTSVNCLSPSSAEVEVHKTSPVICDCLTTTATLTTVIETAPTACAAQNPYGIHFTEDCS